MKAQMILNAYQENNNVKTVGCMFITANYAPGHERYYTYKTTLALEVGDYVVVETAKGFTVVQVAEVHDESQIRGTTDIEYKWVVCKIDATDYDVLVANDKKALAVIEVDLKKHE